MTEEMVGSAGDRRGSDVKSADASERELVVTNGHVSAEVGTADVGTADARDDWAASFIGALVRGLDESGARWLVLRNHEDLPDRVGHDVDILVHPGDEARIDPLVRAIVSQQGLLLLRAYEGMEHHTFDVAASDLRGRLLLHVDFQTGARYRGRTLIDAEDLLTERRRQAGMWVLSPGMEAYALLLHAALHKGELKPKYAERLEALGAEEPGGLLRVAEARLDATLAHELADVRTGAQLAALRTRLAEAVDRRYPGNRVGRPLFTVKSGIRQTSLRIKPQGLFVVFLGPDGAGKSSTTDLLAGMLGTQSNVLPVHRVYLGSGQPLLPTRKLMRHLHLKSGRRVEHDRPVRDVRPRRLRGALHVMADEIVRYWFEVFPRLSPHAIVIADRYAYDVLRVNNPTVRRPWFRRLATMIIPSPDITFFLEGDPAVITARKNELTVEETIRQQDAYRELAPLVPDFRPIDLTIRDDRALRGVALQILDAFARRNRGEVRSQEGRSDGSVPNRGTVLDTDGG